jgi:hypothetical protein
MDDVLLDVVLGRIDGESTLSEAATDLLLAACQGDQALADTLGGTPPPRPSRRDGTGPAADADPATTAPDPAAAEPVGATTNGELHPRPLSRCLVDPATAVLDAPDQVGGAADALLSDDIATARRCVTAIDRTALWGSWFAAGIFAAAITVAEP